MLNILRPATLLCTAALALAACDPAEFDSDPDVRRDARANRTCTNAVADQTGDRAAVLNTTLPVVEINQYIIDVPSTGDRWMCRTDDDGKATQLYRLGAG
ncbi:hypothetical protein [Sulfitobacter sp. S190]|uniref:hypothetical protein n=1 Tax=Sulfitobacter sp. S190 TaxID=2867022 RepID=UPI0021A46DA3|nr:hypothetical protein [Sulfitobacter sp. S190]UWR23875.1 hypothetical protein K3756_07960 [Sulfitobacter sp. S190]